MAVGFHAREGAVMGSELGLDLKLCALRSAGVAATAADHAARIEEYVTGLEEEKLKIEAFRRELPLSAVLISDVIARLREELRQTGSPESDVRETIPPPDGEVLDGGEERRDKMNWLRSVQLWSHVNNDTRKSNDAENSISEADRLESKPRPFTGFLNAVKEESNPVAVVPDLSLTSPAIRSEDNGYSGSGVGRGSLSVVFQSQNQATRKQRRCWSPELHRRFIFALQQLGGAQVATPKQIREHMKVDGLTNDEVKSHLQKYRLHTRRMPPASLVSNTNNKMIVVEGIWTQHDHYPASQKTRLQSASPQGPLQLPTSSLAVSLTAGDSYEEDGKSESYSWK